MAKILIIEDDEIIARFLSGLLLTAGHPAIIVHTAERAREMLESEIDLSLLVLDHHLGGESGLHFLTKIRNGSRHQHLPVLVCSGDTKRTSVSGFLALGIAGFIMKPFTADRFLTEIERALLPGRQRAST
jgi:DNA-binding NtrC family response regulator